MIEPWMMLDNWGHPIAAATLDEGHQKSVALAEARPVADAFPPMAALISRYREGDRIIWYSSLAADWHRGMGCEGYALVRNGFFVDCVVIKVS